jgi:D-alanyl-D-alanine carboxypeptidase
MHHYRYILALSACSIAAVALAGAIRVHQGTVSIGGHYIEIPHIEWGIPHLKIDPSFFLTSGEPTVPTKPKEAVVQGPAVTAAAYLVGNIKTGLIYASHGPDERLPIASMSKLLTAIVAIDTLSPTTTVEITPDEAAAPPDTSGIGAGEKYSAQELIYPLLLNSSNIAAEALASTTKIRRASFLELMSSYAWEIGMSSTYFADPSGVDPTNQSSARDFFALARYLDVYRPDILSLTRTISISVATTTEHGAHVFASIHPFVRDPRFIGGKTGRTPEAGETMLTIMNINDQLIAFIVLGSQIDHRASDTKILIDYVNGMVK